ncbi:hypothetical protein Pyn_21572 [Prunus yedoensis var. nudiflora]|uniref:Uncharacterized protein n=1 Tax=Prunus yedoensis var. nudiflora TaxID=2094558 RepID=A0A314XX29_PRUYE|nr:hypothetical protein Pyn_21572 [Prunus yedoensis var. nudiflora]
MVKFNYRAHTCGSQGDADQQTGVNVVPAETDTDSCWVCIKSCNHFLSGSESNSGSGPNLNKDSYKQPREWISERVLVASEVVEGKLWKEPERGKKKAYLDRDRGWQL